MSVPSVPQNVTAVGGDRYITVSWTAPASDGGSPITGYRVGLSTGAQITEVGASTFTVTFTGLTNDTTSYFPRVSAINANGYSTYVQVSATPKNPNNIVAYNSAFVVGGSGQTPSIEYSFGDTQIGPSGEIYVIGTTTSAGFSISGTVIGPITKSGTATQGFILSYNASGSLQWGQVINSSGSRVTSAKGTSGFVYVGGFVGQSGFVVSGLSAPDSTMNGYVVKYNLSGIPVWSNMIGGSGSDNVMSILVNNSTDAVYAIGITTSSGFAYDGIVGGKQDGRSDVYMIVYDKDGTQLYNKRITQVISGANASGAFLGASFSATSTAAAVQAAAIDSFGNVCIVGGSTAGTFIISGVAGVSGTGISGTLTTVDAFVACLTGSGTPIWAQRIIGSSAEIGCNVTSASGVYYVVGYTTSSGFTISGITLPAKTSTTYSQFIVCYNLSGQALWGDLVDSAQAATQTSAPSVVANSQYVVWNPHSTSGALIGTISGTAIINASGSAQRITLVYNMSGQRVWGVNTMNSSWGQVTTAPPIQLIDRSGYIITESAVVSSGLTLSGTGITTQSSNDILVYKIDPYLPSAPYNVAPYATASGQASFSWAAPVQTGLGGAIANYTVTVNPGNFTGTFTSLSGTITGLTNGTTYTASVVATNSGGYVSPVSQPSAPFTLGVPAAPTNVTVANMYMTAARISWTAPADVGFSALTGYTVTAHSTYNARISKSISVGASATSAYIDGLIPDYYTFEVKANNSVGASLPAYSAIRSTQTNAVGGFVISGVSTSALTTNVSTYINNASGRIYVAGLVDRSGFTLSPFIGNKMNGSGDLVIAYYNMSGSVVYARTINGGASSSAYGVTAIASTQSKVYILSNVTISGLYTPGAIDKRDASTDGYLQVMNGNDGQLLDSYLIGGSGTDLALNMAFENDRIYVVGTTNTSGFLGKPNNNTAGYVIAYATTGEILWSKYIGGQMNETTTSVATTSGYVYVTGTIQASGAPISGTSFNKATTATYSYVQVYDKDGNNVRGQLIGNSTTFATTYPTTSAIDTSGNIYIAFETNTSGFTISGTSILKRNTSYDVYVVSYDKNLNARWGTIIGGSGSESNPAGMVVDQSGYLYLSVRTSTSGGFIISGSASYSSNNVSSTTGIACFNPSGVNVWSTIYNSISTTANQSLTTDTSGYLYVTQYTKSGVLIPGMSLSNPSGSDIVIVKYYPFFVDATAAGNTDGSVSLSWIPPRTLATLSGYVITCSGQPTQSLAGSATTAQFSSLTGGTRYQFTITATNASGETAFATVSATPTTVPSAPSSVTAVAGNNQAYVSWPAPANGGVAISSYTVTSSPGGFTATTANGTDTYAKVTGLTNGTAYTFTVTATNAIGTSSASAASNSVTPSASTAPFPPTGVRASPGNTRATVSWTASEPNGGAVTSYTVTSSPGNITATTADGSTTTAIVEGLTNEIQYTFTVTATNAIGTSSASSASNIVNPSVYSLGWAGMIAGNGNEFIYNTSMNASGFVAITGTTTSTNFTISGTTVSGWNVPGQHVFVAVYNSSGVAQWARMIQDAYVYGVSINQSGYVAVTGYITTAAPFFISGTTVSGWVANSTDSYVAVYNNSGDAVWATIVGGSGIQSIYNCALDNSGMVYTVGYLQNAVGFTISGTSIVNYTTSGADAFVAAYDTVVTGNAVWASLIAGAGNEYGYSIATNSSGWAYIAGSFGPTTLTISGTTISGTSMNEAGLVVAYNQSGTVMWARTIDGVSVDRAYNIAANNSGLVFVKGITASSSFTVSGTSISGWVRSPATYDAFVIAYNNSGNPIWGNMIPADFGAYSNNIAVGGNGTVLVAGTTTMCGFTISGTTISGWVRQGAQDVYTIVYNSSGIAIWGTMIGGSDAESGNGTAINENRNIVVVGSTNSYGFAISGSTMSGSQALTYEGFLSYYVYNGDVVVVAPGAPTGVSATPGNAQASVAFTAPTNTGGAAITSYTVTSSPGGFTGTGASSPITVSGLTNGTAYTFTVTATNSAGTGAASAASSAVTPRTVPGAPTGVSATPGNAEASVAFTAPADNGGAAITGYTVTSSPGGFTGTGASSPITVSGLTNGTAYTFTVTATNAAGTGAASSASSAVTPTSGGPSAPTSLTASTLNGTATVSWSAPASGAPISSYAVTSTPAGFSATVDGAVTTATFTNVPYFTSYTFSVTATNAGGTGPAATSNSVVAIPVVESVVAVASDASAVVKWAPLSTAAAAGLSSFLVTSSPGGFTATVSGGTATTATVTGLTNGTAYTFTVRANTATQGNGANSAASAAVTPAASNTFSAIDQVVQSSSTTALANFLVADTARTPETKLVETKSAINSDPAAYTTAEYASMQEQYIAALRQDLSATAGTVAKMTIADARELAASLITADTSITTNTPATVILPDYSQGNATVDLSSETLDGSQFIHVEVPRDRTATVVVNGQSSVLSYSGNTLLVDGVAPAIGSIITIGTAQFRLVGYGSALLLPIFQAAVAGAGIRMFAQGSIRVMFQGRGRIF